VKAAPAEGPLLAAAGDGCDGELSAGVLATAVGMEDHRTGGATLLAGGLEGIGDQVGSQVISSRPADHAARGDVDDGGQV
jgi:hypothetical protein